MKRIMVVDDSTLALKFVEAQLKGFFDVVLAQSGEQALEMLSREVPDLIILDIEMPNMDGFETMRRIKAIPAASRTPVIFLTGKHDNATQVRALESGGVDFIKKPFEKGVLLHRIDVHLSLFDYQRSLENTVKNMTDTIVSSFADLIERRKGGHGDRSMRAGALMKFLGRLLLDAGMLQGEADDAFLEMIVRASTLHDIGKIGINDEIMQKPGSLTEEEFNEIKKHTLIGARELEKMHKRTPSQSYLEYASLMAEGHHERYDGSGYPHGLAGDEIPIVCRLLAVVDVYDSLLSDTAYRPAMSHEEARRIIEKGAGKAFDPAIVEIFLANHEQFEEIARQFV